MLSEAKDRFCESHWTPEVVLRKPKVGLQKPLLLLLLFKSDVIVFLCARFL